MKTLPRIFITLFLTFLGLSNHVFAIATPIYDYTRANFSWVALLGNYGPEFTNINGYNNQSFGTWFYGPFLLSTDKTNTNAITMWFRETSASGTPYVCPDIYTENPYSYKFSNIELFNVADASSTRTEALLAIGIDGNSSSPVSPINLSSDNPITNGGWTQNSNGSCTSRLNNTNNLIKSGWYIIRFPYTAVYNGSQQNFDNEVAQDLQDTHQVSILGDDSYDTALIGQSQNSIYYTFTSNYATAGYAPLEPKFPTLSFSYVAPPVVGDIISCNPFSGDIMHFFLNYDFNFAICLGDTSDWLFKPTKSSMQQFTDLKEQIQNKPPFGYFTIITNGLDSITATTSTATTTVDDIDIPSYLSTMVFTPIKNGLTILLWFILLVFLFNRIKHIQL